jgi:hypothetical protein
MRLWLAVVVTAMVVHAGWATPDVELTQLERSPVKMGDAWYMFASDFDRTCGSVGIFNMDEKALDITKGGRGINYTIGSDKALVFNGKKYETVKLLRAVWIDADHIVIPIEVTVEALGIALAIEEKKGIMIMITDTQTIQVPIHDQPKWMAVILNEGKLELYQGPWLFATLDCPVTPLDPAEYRKLASGWAEPTTPIQVVRLRRELKPWRELFPRKLLPLPPGLFKSVPA